VLVSLDALLMIHTYRGRNPAGTQQQPGGGPGGQTAPFLFISRSDLSLIP